MLTQPKKPMNLQFVGSSLCVGTKNDYIWGIMSNRDFIERLLDLQRKYAGEGLVDFVDRIFTFDYRYDDDRKEAVDMEFKFLTAMRDDISDLLKIVKEETPEYKALADMKSLFDERITSIIRNFNIR